MKKYSFLYNQQLSARHRHYGPLKRPSSALWWFRTNLAMLHGQNNGLYGALPKLTSAEELQRSTFNLHVFVLCCKISATTFTLWIKLYLYLGTKSTNTRCVLLQIVGPLVTLKKTVVNTAVLEDKTTDEAWVFLLAWVPSFFF